MNKKVIIIAASVVAVATAATVAIIKCRKKGKENKAEQPEPAATEQK